MLVVITMNPSWPPSWRQRFSKSRWNARDDYEPARLADRTQRNIDSAHLEHDLASRLRRALVSIKLNAHRLAAASEVLLLRAVGKETLKVGLEASRLGPPPQANSAGVACL